MTEATTRDGEPSDSALIARWRGGDERAATILVERHASAVARFVASMGARGEVEDVVQDTFVRAFGSLDSFREQSALRTWLFSIARNLWRDRARANRRAVPVVPVNETHAVTENDPLEVAVATETESRLAAALDGLTETQREVFTLRVSEGMSYREIAEVVGTTEGAARVHYHNAMRAVKEFLND
ncbi:MAG: RNA polymerase sigma factor [Gemmatimonadaceae bacterium]